MVTDDAGATAGELASEDDPYVREVAVFGGVAVQSSRPSDEDVVAALRDGVEQVVTQCIGIELSWSTSAVVASDDLSSSAADTGRDGIDWDFALGRGEPLRSVALVATATAMEGYHWHPKWLPVTVAATMPVPVAHGRGDGGGLVVRLSMHRWAMYGGGEDAVRVQGFLEPWLLRTAERLAADTGFATLDQVSADVDESPWERANGIGPSARDVTRTLWGYGWGTLLSPVHVDALGGRSALEALRDVVPSAQLVDVGDRTWVRLGPDLGAVRREDVRALREVLLAALPRGPRTVEEFERAHARNESVETFIL
ncbi:hypothetical protein ICW40_11015 [Actinotalea ferrariae]|uniref:hypothetical protein n=1 Tax=Actinotalea ferrariae TaxID=1386098 RepID=UPI001C8C05AE|nr:hypothetical protein [Actinotalea ferrariae]MBX9245334.1 hypothetical protein [Actinotalea ferrariae]